MAPRDQLERDDQGSKRKAGSTSETLSIQSTSFPAVAEDEEDAVPPLEEEVRDEPYGQLNTQVVGTRLYRGLVGPGQEVLLVRGSGINRSVHTIRCSFIIPNLRDSSALQVKNCSRVLVGNVPRGVASKLAPLMDQKRISVEGVINDGNSATLKFYGHPDDRAAVIPQLPTGTRISAPSYPQAIASRPTNNSQVITHRSSPACGRTERQPNQLEPSQAVPNANELQQILDKLNAVKDTGRSESLLDLVCNKDDILDLPVYGDPPGTQKGNLKVDLLKHQLQALQWCIEKETPVLPTNETERPVQFWQFKKNPNSSNFKVVTRSPQESAPVLGKGGLIGDAMGLGKTLSTIALVLATLNDSTPEKFSKTTLIVAPVSVLSNWEKQIRDHVSSEYLSTHLYYGNSRSISAAELQSYDLVITTYHTLAGEYGGPQESGGASRSKKKKVEGVLMDIPWKRVVLDEGHIVRNPKTKIAQAVYALTADKRWILSGTPIVSLRQKDLGSMLTFLKICKPLDCEDFFNRLLLRPLKNGVASGAQLLKALMSHICIRRTKEMQDAKGVPLISLPPVEMIRVYVTLTEDVRRLYDQIEEMSVKHFERTLKSPKGTIPQVNVLSMLTRLRQLVLHPGLLPASYLDDLTAKEAANVGDPVQIAFVRFDGSMSAKRRQEAIERFSAPVEKPAPSANPGASHKDYRSDLAESGEGDTVSLESGNSVNNRGSRLNQANARVMLISLKAGALGLNLTVANNVFLMDPWWQEAIESQAIDRVNRIGQKRNIRIYQLIAKNTVESKVLEIQGRKKELIKAAFSGTRSKETQRQQKEARIQGALPFRVSTQTRGACSQKLVLRSHRSIQTTENKHRPSRGGVNFLRLEATTRRGIYSAVRYFKFNFVMPLFSLCAPGSPLNCPPLMHKSRHLPRPAKRGKFTNRLGC
ncbi:hypothetical protein FA13DRAFT_1650493 [Coprinellus micaceus]|uniref:Helicase ATP-binding domain-containing protein n=1 Tax=Coprinellus micaceus TaxID=71717 RepID=A0A4Y7S5Y9_COPMI|nr:hypothetical protein FA13DRAFT_1650493 [Coprinellus micaceus]